jgi:hypothetical protein
MQLEEDYFRVSRAPRLTSPYMDARQAACRHVCFTGAKQNKSPSAFSLVANSAAAQEAFLRALCTVGLHIFA